MSEELDLFLTRKLVDLLPGSMVMKKTALHEKHPHYFLHIPGKEPMLLARGFKAAQQAVKLYRDNLIACKEKK